MVRCPEGLTKGGFADLSKEHVTAGGVNVVVAGVAGVDHEAVDELHGLGTLTAQLAGDHHLATLRPGLHDEAKNTIARTANKFSRLKRPLTMSTFEYSRCEFFILMSVLDMWTFCVYIE